MVVSILSAGFCECSRLNPSPEPWQTAGSGDVRRPEWQRPPCCPTSRQAGALPLPPRPSCDAHTPACLRGRKEVRRAAGSFPFLPLLQAPSSFPVSASEEGRQHHGPQRGRHPPDLLLLQRAHCHHRPGHLPCVMLRPGHCVCVRRRERAPPHLLNPLNGRIVAHHPLENPGPSFPCSGPWGPSLSKVPAGGEVWGRVEPAAVAGVERGVLFYEYSSHSLWRLSFCLCEMGPSAPQAHSGSNSSRCESALETRNSGGT